MTEEAPKYEGYQETQARFKEATLLQFATHFQKAGTILSDHGYLIKTDQGFSFLREDATNNHSDQAFRRRVGMHTIATGVTMYLLTESLFFEGILGKFAKTTWGDVTSVMMLHDLTKLQEITDRERLGSADQAYTEAQNTLSTILQEQNFSAEMIELAESVGHIGARDFITAKSNWTPLRQCAYLADELTQEHALQTDPLAKVKRLKSDRRYSDIDRSGFPERFGDPIFMLENGLLKPKYLVQEEATRQMASQIEKLLYLKQPLGTHLIEKAGAMGFLQHP